MGFNNGSYATVWEVRRADKGTTLRITTSYKDKKTDQYVQDFSGFVSCYGDAGIAAAKLKQKDRIKLDRVDVCNRYDSEKKKEYVTYKIFEFSKVDKSKPGSTRKNEPIAADPGDDELPF